MSDQNAHRKEMDKEMDKGIVGNGKKIHIVRNGRAVCGAGVFNAIHRLGSTSPVSLVGAHEPVTCKRCADIHKDEVADEVALEPPKEVEEEVVDCDGKPVRVGDYVHSYGASGRVVAIRGGLLMIKKGRKTVTREGSQVRKPLAFNN